MQQLILPFESVPLLLRVRDILRTEYGLQRDDERHHPTLQLFKAIISSRTLDAISDNAFQNLIARFPSLELLATADPQEIAVAIGNVKFPERKAFYLIETARMLLAEYGSLDISFLGHLPVGTAMSWLRRFYGVGSKVAAVTLNFSALRMRVFAVDTHVLRFSRRLGLLPRKAGYERGFHLLMEQMPANWEADDLYELHWLIKIHGQRTCQAGKPLCRECRFTQLCNYAAFLFSDLSGDSAGIPSPSCSRLTIASVSGRLRDNTS